MAESSSCAGPADCESSSLYADLLLALVGHEGDIFERDPKHGVTRISGTVHWVPESDRLHLERLCRLGDACSELQGFVDSSWQHSSLYRAALAQGISELLDVYESSVLELEEQLSRQPGTPVLALCHRLEEFQALLPAVARLVRHVSTRDLRGASLLHAVHAATRCGDPDLESCALRLLWHCQGVVLRQLHAWCVHGQGPGESDEFFVRRVEDPVNGGDQPCAADWAAGFEVPSAEADLPPSVSTLAASSALFIGRAVRVLAGAGDSVETGAGSASHSSASMPPSSHALPELQPLSRGLLGLCAAPSFRAAQLDRLLESARAGLATRVWHLLRSAELGARFASMRDYFLLERGDFYQQFLVEASKEHGKRMAAPLLALPPRPATASADVGLLFQQAAVHSSADGDPAFGAFTLSWHPPGGGCPRTTPGLHFGAAEAAHRAFVRDLVSRAFLDARPLASLVQALMEAAARICALIQDIEGERRDAEATLGALRSPERELRLKMTLLLQLLQSGTLQTQSRAPALRHLVLRLTYNGFLAAA
ncbi:hypothetical protein APUTEX25_005083 [Auxenochlorella protothecoides]|uniref:Gamma-tubulin complex component n=1 Tax=Auxenochlorella protothecoides TaxID=3075 RepID=A0A3M7KR94_AUXPR|nr:hypothetical protein APUTEX25_005083 [Auxenochlorella protothecoides]|eukprot:RMZ52330.1 hypothetical protein APUTEX25_005083 [Auxenochlorella protothecoides]